MQHITVSDKVGEIQHGHSNTVWSGSLIRRQPPLYVISDNSSPFLLSFKSDYAVLCTLLAIASIIHRI